MENKDNLKLSRQRGVYAILGALVGDASALGGTLIAIFALLRDFVVSCCLLFKMVHFLLFFEQKQSALDLRRGSREAGFGHFSRVCCTRCQGDSFQIVFLLVENSSFVNVEQFFFLFVNKRIIDRKVQTISPTQQRK